MEEEPEEEQAVEERKPFRPPSAKERFLKEVTGKEERVAVIGKLNAVNKKEMTGMLSHEGTDCELVFTEGEQLLGLEEGKLLRVIGKPSKKPKLSIEVEILQELKGFDSNLFKKVREFEEKYYKSD